MFKTALLLLPLLFALCGCEQSPPPVAETPVKQTVERAGTGLLNAPGQPVAVELASQTLPIWREKVSGKATLVLLSFDPFLKPIPETLRERATALVKTGSREEIDKHGSFNRVDPVILPNQTLSAALSGGLFSRISWVFPSRILPEQLDLGKFREQMIEQKFLTPDEAAALTLEDGVISGQVRDIPFTAVHPARLDAIPAPDILHIDMSYFRGLYDNEIKTPIYGLLRQAADTLRAQHWQPQVTTLSYSTLDGDTALDVRFVISDLAELIRNPAILDGDMPQEWQQRGEALYAADMFSESKKVELAQQLAKIAPESAAAHYDRFQALLQSKQIDPALAALEQAIQLDPGYGAAYIRLAQMAAEDQQTKLALGFVDRAADLYPLNPFIPLQRAHLLAYSQQTAAAQKQLAELPGNWSPVYHAEIPAVIEELQKTLNATENEHSDEKN